MQMPPSTMMKRAHSSYIIVIVIIALLDIWYSSLISEKVQPPIVQQIDFSEIPAPVENITSDEPVQTMNEHIELYNDKFDYMTGPDFEVYCADLLRKNGFIDVSVTSTSGDFGADIIATQNKIKYAIQCKCYSSDIGVDAVYQVTGGMKYYDANVGVVLTNRYFTRQAKELASKTGIALWDRNFLISLVILKLILFQTQEYQDKKMDLMAVMYILKKQVNLLLKKKMRMLVHCKEHLKLVSTEQQELWISFVMQEL